VSYPRVTRQPGPGLKASGIQIAQGKGMPKFVFILSALVLFMVLPASADIVMKSPQTLANGGLKNWSDSYVTTLADIWNDSEALRRRKHLSRRPRYEIE
jgi:hypothetical protein